MIVNEEIFTFFKDKYGINNGHEIIRYGIVVNEETDECIVEIYFR